MEEPGNLDIENQNVTAAPKNARAFFAPTVEFEYGTTAWWLTEVYVQGQATQFDSAIFTGFRFDNRFRPLPGEHWVNPVLYVEYEDVNAGDKSFLEVTGSTSIATLAVPNALLRKEVERSFEEELILSSNIMGWNLSENFISEKALNEPEPWEFGYALAVSRPRGLGALLPQRQRAEVQRCGEPLHPDVATGACERNAQCSTGVRKHVTEPGRPGSVGCVSAVADRKLRRRLDPPETMQSVFRGNLSWLTLIAALRIIEAAPIQFGGVAQMVRATDS